MDQKQGQPVTDEEIKIALKDTYCRCTGYVTVDNAIKAANGQDVSLEEYLPETKHGYNVVGEALPRADAVAKVTGAAIYTDDVTFPDMLCGATLRANIPHALIKKIDTSKAKALPGVHAVLTHEDVPGRKNHGLVTIDWPVSLLRQGALRRRCGRDRRGGYARHREERVEADRGGVRAAARGRYAGVRPSTRCAESPRSGNLLKHIKVVKGDVEQGFAEADVVIERTYHTASTEHAFLEPECAVGRDDGRWPYTRSMSARKFRIKIASRWPIR